MTSSYVIRGFRPEDIESCLRLHAEAGGDRDGPLCMDFVGRLGRPGCSPGEDVSVAEEAGEVTGCLEMFPEAGIDRMVVSCHVKKEHRRRGISRRFLERSGRRARELGIRKLQACVDEADETANKVLASLGFRKVRRFLEMRMDLEEFREAPSGACRSMRAGEEDILLYLQNRAFEGSWGYNPNTPEQIRYHFSRGEASPEDVIICFAGDSPAAYCWTMAPERRDSGTIKGRIYMLGVAPDYRGKGFGRMALRAGLSRLKRKGITEADITVDSENSIALSLYRATGFELRANSLWYERVLD